ncbi:hypothetical protein QMK33_12255 [Hymenobacter sp. H14-R3]|uniref:hypothetical protein n=1 Tax=Hymenobacter sp. H14-R3 TaxID=3046308 RepID=UPI0024B8CFBD|nr:hypothetical protein [Hymenobacter sp. H14-R3]MDJ0365927.1 hypothetical protein [Hymenobacter sp. H14-R3]
MRFIAFIFLATGPGLLTACQQESPQTTGQQPTTALPPTPAGPQCYAYTTGKDTVRLTLQTTEPTATGQLTYNYFEKDRNEGTIQGTLRGDTLRADYTFQSEGTTSVRQVAFVRRGVGFVKGYGDVAERAGKTVFAKPQALRFDSKNVLSPIDCPK